jgi:(1->4)-alpha-D-glucan 1-alpha-D-glucosylmutase
LSAAEFHARMTARAARSPNGLTATATHDTKRGEDARARILALSELPDEWSSAVTEWRRLNAGHSVSAGHEYMVYQALLGCWPVGSEAADLADRFEAYATKAAREGKSETSWVNPNETYEGSLRDFVRKLLDPRRSADFLRSFDAFARRIALMGALNSLSQLVLKAAMPGVPDFYQGTEFWDLSLVDPDNRRPVDFGARAKVFAEGTGGWNWGDLAARWTDGRIKLALTERLLALRRRMPALFREGHYHPVEVRGEGADHVLAFMRAHGRQRVLVAVERHFASLTNGGRYWPTSAWPVELVVGDAQRGDWHDALGTLRDPTPRSFVIPQLFETLPVAVLHAG